MVRRKSLFQFRMSRAFFVVEVVIFLASKDGLRGDGEAFTERRVRVADASSNVGNDVGLAVLGVAVLALNGLVDSTTYFHGRLSQCLILLQNQINTLLRDFEQRRPLDITAWHGGIQPC